MDRFDPVIVAARKHGAEDVVLVSAKNDIVIERRVSLLCQFGCGEYGKRLTCPPYAPQAEDFVADYEHALLMTFLCPAGITLQKSRCLMSLTHGAEDPEVKTFWKEWYSWKRLLYERLLDLERAAFAVDLPFSLAFGVGCCPWCIECVDSYPGCRFPSKRRCSMEAIGINVVATCAKAGIVLTFPVAGFPKVATLLLLGCLSSTRRHTRWLPPTALALAHREKM
jgi:predicted metal-binding protein